jgi:hypothetical protein
LNKTDQIAIQKNITDLLGKDGRIPKVSIFASYEKQGAMTEPFFMVMQSAEFILAQTLKASEYQIYGFMRAMSQYNNQVNVEIKIIAVSLGISERTVKSAIKQLEAYNILKVISHPFDARRNIYELNPQSYWKGTAEKYEEVMNRFGYVSKLKKGVNQLVLELGEKK